MEQHYKSFMNKQHPSKDLLSETISKAKALSEEEQEGKLRRDLDAEGSSIWMKGIHVWNQRRWQCGIVVFAVICLILTGVWRWNTRIVYPNLVTEFSPDEESDYREKRAEEFGEERNSYLNFNFSYLYVFDKEAEKTEIEVGQGTIIVQTGTVKIAGNQLLYQIKPQNIKGIEVFLGKTESDGEECLLAAFDLGELHYYLKGEMVSEREMTAYIKDLINNYEK